MTLLRLVLAPEVTYSAVAKTVEAMGWRFEAGPAYPPLVDGEPELATWRRDGASLVYTCNPVAWLRLLDLAGVDDPADRLDLLTQLPLLSPARIERLLRAGAAESVLLGVLAADVLALRAQLPAIRALMHHRDSAVAAAARRATGSLTRSVGVDP